MFYFKPFLLDWILFLMQNYNSMNWCNRMHSQEFDIWVFRSREDVWEELNQFCWYFVTELWETGAKTAKYRWLGRGRVEWRAHDTGHIRAERFVLINVEHNLKLPNTSFIISPSTQDHSCHNHKFWFQQKLGKQEKIFNICYRLSLTLI